MKGSNQPELWYELNRQPLSLPFSISLTLSFSLSLCPSLSLTLTFFLSLSVLAGPGCCHRRSHDSPPQGRLGAVMSPAPLQETRAREAREEKRRERDGQIDRKVLSDFAHSVVSFATPPSSSSQQFRDQRQFPSLTVF